MKKNSFNQNLFDSLLAKLISFETLSGENNLSLINFVEGYFKQYNIPCFFSGSQQNHQKNLIAIIDPKQKNNISQGLLLSGHTDIVDVKNQPWSTHPFQLKFQNQKYYGRGSCDMKGFLALIMSIVPSIIQNKKLKKPLGFAFTYDEETNYNGVQSLIQWLAENKQKPAMAIVGEPSECSIITSHKGESYLDCQLYGLASHSSMPEKGINTIYYASQLIQELENIYYQNKTLLNQDNRFDPPHSSLSVGTISGGSATNIVADYCQFSWEIRTLFNDDLKHIMQRVETKIAELNTKIKKQHSNAKIKLIKHYTAPPLEQQENSTLNQLLQRHADDPELKCASFGTEAGFYQKAGIDSAVWGPGSIIQAHKADEYIELQQIEKYHQQLLSVLDNYCCV